MFGKKKDKPIELIYFSGLRGFQQDTTCFIDTDNENVTIQTKKKPIVTANLKNENVKSVDIMDEKEFYQHYFNVNKKPVKVMNKTFIILNFVSSEGSDEKLMFYTFKLKPILRMKNLVKDITSNAEPTEYTL